MATTLDLPPYAQSLPRSRDDSPLAVLRWIFSPLASLKLTLVLLASAIFLIFAGTFAQAKAGMWEAMSLYFKSWYVWIDLQVFFPEDWFRGSAPWIYDIVRPGMGFPFPGGASIGLAMMVNLLSAHMVRFRVQVRGMRLFMGLSALVLGVLLTWVVIALGDFQQGLRSTPLMSWETTAALTLVAAAVASLGLMGLGVWRAVSVEQAGNKSRWAQVGLSFTGAGLALVGCILLVMFYNDLSALRILWQLIQGLVAGVALLAACWLLFDKRAGIVALHGGVALMMFSQVFVSLGAVEERMSIDEGDVATYAIDTRVIELAVVTSTDTEERHTIVPHEVLQAALWAEGAKKRLVSHDDLPFDIEILQYYRNSDLADVEEGAKNPATQGVGRGVLLVEKPVGAGASSDAEIDSPAAYVKLTEKSSGKDLGVYALSTRLLDDQVRLGDKAYSLALRFQRTYKPYKILLNDVVKEDYPGSDTPRTYESLVQFTDPANNVDRPVKISMNNPFRYLGETFYQSGYFRNPRDGSETTTLQVVTNAGWMTPYVACMIVVVGLLYQFVQTLMRFLVADPAGAARGVMLATAIASGGIPGMAIAGTAMAAAPPEKKRRKPKREDEEAAPQPSGESWWSWFRPSWLAIGMMVLCIGIIVAGLFKPTPKAGGFDLYAFGSLPVIDQGRAKPLDSLARETLLTISNKTTYKVSSKGKSRPAIEWLLTTIATPKQGDELQIIRIDNPDVIAALGLDSDREGMRYSMGELRAKAAEYDKQLKKLREKDPETFTAFEKKFAELSNRVKNHMRLYHAFVPQPLPEMPDRDKLKENDPAAFQQAGDVIEVLKGFGAMVEESRPPLAVPVKDKALEMIAKDKKWIPFSVAAMFAEMRLGILPSEHSQLDEPTAALSGIFAAYAEGDAEAFNKRVADYADWLERHEPEHYQASKVNDEAFLNHFAPFGWTGGILLYFLAFIVASLGLLMFRQQLGSAAFWMLVVTLLLHTWALWERIDISGRPPVTNLYSSAVFIGWVAVILGLALEGFFRLGVGNFVAAIAGMAGLLIADKLSLDPSHPDNIGVMQAVLDTQFWLATHVVCITVGYASTFLAGLLGIAYILLGVFTPVINTRDGKLLGRMIYGVVCFALFFSFFGTVLGGLWADDSWGRFWGWDPKENGALIIVLWNAFILHARWDKLANERGLAVLAVVGNIVTSWSWFGTNQLGVGLHSYGFTSGILLTLGLFVLAHLIVIGIGLLPKQLWLSYRTRALAGA